jgi:hypothetical protein
LETGLGLPISAWWSADLGLGLLFCSLVEWWSLSKVVVVAGFFLVVDFGLILKWSSISVKGWSVDLDLGVDLVVFVGFG